MKSEHTKTQETYWLLKFQKMCQKLNKEHGSVDYVMPKTEWLYKVNFEIAVSCLRMTPPVTSPSVFAFLKKKGGIRACISYLEYVCSIESDKVFHNELACLLVQNYLRANNNADNGKILEFFRHSDKFEPKVVLKLISKQNESQQ